MGRLTVALFYPNQSCLPFSQGSCSLRQDRLVGAGGLVHVLRSGGRGEARRLRPALGPTLLCIWKSVMPSMSAFLSPVYVLEILFSLLKKRLCSSRGVCRGGSGLYNSAVSSTMLRKREKRRKNKLKQGTSAVSVKSLRSWCHKGVWV